MNIHTIYSDESFDYVRPAIPRVGEKIIVSMRVEKGASYKVELVKLPNETLHEITLSESDSYFDYYRYESILEEAIFSYVFKISTDTEIIYLDRVGVSLDIRKDVAFRIIADFDTPDWAKGAIMYQIFVDRFHRADTGNDVLDDEYIYIGLPVKHRDDWYENPSAFDVGYFYGGDLAGVWKKMDYLKDLGVEVLYFNPLFVSPSNHKYDTQDYSHIDPHIAKVVIDEGDIITEDLQDRADANLFATKYSSRTTDKRNLEASDAFFRDFVAAAHEKGIRIIIDGVFNHCGSFHKWLDREGIYKETSKKEGYPLGAFWGRESIYRSYFNFSKSGSYDGWWGHETLPKLYYENSPSLTKEILSIARKWVSAPYHVDGWRLDVAADLGYSPEFNHYFWKMFRREVKNANPDALILAEHYGDPSAWLKGDQWDSVMNYDGFMEPVSWFLTGLEKHSDREDKNLLGNGEAFFDMILFALAKLPWKSVLVAMNELSNHDHSRFLTRTNGKVGRLHTLGSAAAEENVKIPVMRQAIIMQMTLPGAPTIYYGDEVGVCGFTDPDNRRTYPWGRENLDLLEFHRYMNKIHAQFQVLKSGSFMKIYASKDVICYARCQLGIKVLTLIHTGDEGIDVTLPIWLCGVDKEYDVTRVMYSDDKGYNVGHVKKDVVDGYMQVKLAAHSGAIYYCE